MATSCYNARDAYLPASFKGVPLDVMTAESDHGRRGAEGEFPFGEITAYADMGIRIRTFSMRARFAENSHVIDAGLLIAACETPGPGTLVHPARGILLVACRSCRVSDDLKGEAGVTYVDLDFVDAGEAFSGLGLIAGAAQFVLTPFVAALRSSFSSRYQPDNVRFYDAADVVGTMYQTVARLESSYNEATRNNSPASRSAINRDFQSVRLDPYVLADSDTSFNVMENSFNFIDSDANSVDRVGVMRDLLSWSKQTSGLDGESAMAQDAIYQTMRLLTSAYLVKAYMANPPSTVDEGLTQFEIVMSQLDIEADAANIDCDDAALFLAIRAFGTLVSRLMINRAYNSPSLVAYNFASPTHSLVAAWEIYGDAGRADDIMRRNPGMPWAVGSQVFAEKSA